MLKNSRYTIWTYLRGLEWLPRNADRISNIRFDVNSLIHLSILIALADVLKAMPQYTCSPVSSI